MRRALRRADRRGTDERGAAAVEFALVVPILLILVFGIVNFGQYLSVRQTATQAAAEGARAAAVTIAGGNPTTNGVAAMNNALSGTGSTCGHGATCTISIVACGTVQCAHATVTINFDPLVGGFPNVVLPGTVSYTAVAEVN
jgi:Flp pilus assembly protein TadG